MGGYHEYCGGVQYCGGIQIINDFLPYGTEHPHSTQNIPYVHHDIPHGIEYPPQYSK